MVWLLILVWSTTGHAQHRYQSDYYTDVQQIDGRYGLESTIIRTIYQDKKGFVWISTPGGLARFDGYEFLYFKDPRFIGKINSGIDIIGDVQGKLIVAVKRIENTLDALS